MSTPTRLALFLSALTLGGVSFACSSNPTSVTTTDDGGVAADANRPLESERTDDAGSTADATKKDADAKPLACNQQTSRTFLEVFNNPNGNLGNATGGVPLKNGQYVLKNAYVVSDAPQPDFAADLWIADGRYELQIETRDGERTSYGGTIDYAGTKMIMTVDCGGQASAPDWQYSSPPNSQSVTTTFTDKNGLGWVYVFFKRAS